jgi:hypothetical protein
MNLYSSDARYLYELVQNAEDNSYTDAATRNQPPFLHFSIYPDKIYVDTNEDGFTTENVEGICSIGRSRRQNAQGYIGEKGIGFKSVFKIASRVHVQSGPFSFSFTHTQAADEDGLGMITPYNEPHARLPPGVRTRFTLTPRDDSSFRQRVQDIEALPDTFLLFLLKLKKIKISVYDPAVEAKHTEYSVILGSESNVEVIVHEVIVGNDVNRRTSQFHVFKRNIEGLPEDAARPGHNAAEVVLAFPVGQDNNPIETQQYTFAYLPLRNLGFNVGSEVFCLNEAC